MEPKSFYKGQEVICIDADFSDLPPNYRIIFKFPIETFKYRIRSQYNDGGVLLEEIRNEIVRLPSGTVREPGFHSDRFKIYSPPLTSKSKSKNPFRKNSF